MQLQHSFQNILIIPPITPQSAIFGFIDHKVNYHLINHILIIFKYYVYKTTENGSLGYKVLKRNIHFYYYYYYYYYYYFCYYYYFL